MSSRIIRGVKRALGWHYPGRNLRVFPDDVFIVSYPKSGNTWTRFLIANLVHPEAQADFANINRIIPDPEGLSKRQLDALPRPRIIKSHQYFDPRFRQVLYVVRDPRDVALSQYHFHRKRRLIEDSYPIESFLPRFLAGETSPYGSWAENVGSWLATRKDSPGFLLLRYEDLMQDTVGRLEVIARFLDIPADQARLRQAAQRSSAEEMRRLEQAGARQWSTTRDTRQDVPFVRAAKAGGWKESLPPAAVAAIESAWGRWMEELGYELFSDGNFSPAGAPGGRERAPG
jgi:hypothetical protein